MNIVAAVLIGASVGVIYYIIKNHPPGDGGFRGRFA